MYVVIIGMGEVGRHVAKVLQADKHDVVAVDNNLDVIQRVEERLDIASLRGWGASPPVLKQAGVSKADLVVAVTNQDEVNLLAALASKQLGAKRTMARLQGKDYQDRDKGVIHGMFGIDVVVNPRILVAQEISKIARSHGAIDVLGLAGNRIELVQVELGSKSKVLHRPLSKLHMADQTLVAAVVRDRELFVPGGADVLLPGDRIYLIGRAEKMEEVEDQFCGGREATRVCIVGGGVTGESLARNLSRFDVHVILIEKDRETADRLAVDLPRVLVLCGDGTDLRLLEEENIGNFDLFCSVGHNDEVTLMSGLLAKQVGVPRVVCLVHSPDYMRIYRHLGIDIVISPRQVASDHILQYVRKTELKSLHSVEDGQAEVLEVVAGKGSRIVGTPIRKLNIPRGAILASLVSDDQARVPKGDDIIHEGDIAVVLTTVAARPAVDRLFRKRNL